MFLSLVVVVVVVEFEWWEIRASALAKKNMILVVADMRANENVYLTWRSVRARARSQIDMKSMWGRQASEQRRKSKRSESVRLSKV